MPLFKIIFETSSLIFGLFVYVLFNFQGFNDFLLLFYYWFLVYFCYGQKTYLLRLQFFYVSSVLVYDLEYSCFVCMCVCDTVVWTQGLVLAKQVLY
jgi:hypothetical protein